MDHSLDESGFEIIENVYEQEEIAEILTLINTKKVKNAFGVRAFLVNYPEIAEKVFTQKLLTLIKQIALNCQTCIKSIYFDKPPNANWVVTWHQDLTINLLHKKEVEGFKNWRVNKERTTVQPIFLSVFLR